MDVHLPAGVAGPEPLDVDVRLNEPGLMLAHLPTPLESADRLGAVIAVAPGRLWVKRDDCMGLATGGNKARKLERLVADTLATNSGVLITAGGPQSNHARTTAAAAPLPLTLGE
jgi:1-aminocyclopropane-1-carboxylate deaminase/D-cysteine desulfhydrase-like pyridoxal-dependent ACC family enzyme